ncbi:MAG: hypothetical protein K6G52_05085 [Treponemataceae bacterium]|nr:hypothetical protein [Treponemataceae bacterium]
MEKRYSNEGGKKHWKHNGHNKNKHQNQQKEEKKVEEYDLPKIEYKIANCAYCGKPIEDMSCALGSKESGEPVHFDCVIEKITETEKIQNDEKITYIGQGRFGVVHFDNPQDLRHFQIRRIIEWESREEKKEWRQEIADSFSSIK